MDSGGGPTRGGHDGPHAEAGVVRLQVPHGGKVTQGAANEAAEHIDGRAAPGLRRLPEPKRGSLGRLRLRMLCLWLLMPLLLLVRACGRWPGKGKTTDGWVSWDGSQTRCEDAQHGKERAQEIACLCLYLSRLVAGILYLPRGCEHREFEWQIHAKTAHGAC
jgi:hypothetical protein